jgi:hypothetical protein
VSGQDYPLRQSPLYQSSIHILDNDINPAGAPLDIEEDGTVIY